MATSKPQPPESPDPKLIDKFLDLQTKELEFNQQRLALDKASNDANIALAHKTVDHNIKMLEHAPQHKRDERKQLFTYALISAAILMVAAGLLIKTNNKDILMEAGKWGVKVLIFAIGYFAGSRNNNQGSTTAGADDAIT